MVKKEMNIYILAIVCIVAIVGIVLFVSNMNTCCGSSADSLAGEAYKEATRDNKGDKDSCSSKTCRAGELVLCYQDETGKCQCPPCSK